MSPGPEEAKFPTALPDLPAPRVRTYPRATVVAEKFEAMARFAGRNSRMKDYHDIWALSSQFSFDGAALRASVEACFTRRGTRLTDDGPTPLVTAFYVDDDVVRRWDAYVRRGGFVVAPPSQFDVVGERIQAFLEPVTDSILDGSTFAMSWEPGGGWK
jgi:hypothetical protein